MEYVYLVYAECDGLRGIFRSEASADRRVLEIASNEMDIDTSVAPLDYSSPWRWGWDVCYWRKELVYP